MIKREHIKQAIDAISRRSPDIGYSLDQMLGMGVIDTAAGAQDGDNLHFVFDDEKVLVNKVLFFNEAYYGLYDVCMRMERDAGGREEYGRRGGAWLARLDQSLSSLQQQLPRDHPLVRELEGYRDRQKQRLEELFRGSSGPS